MRRTSPRYRSVCTPQSDPTPAAISLIASCSAKEVFREGIDGDHRRDAMPANDMQMLEQVGRTEVDLFGVLHQHPGRERPACVNLVSPRMEFEGPYVTTTTACVGHQAGGAAFDVEEPLGAHVRAEAGPVIRYSPA